MHHLEVSGAVRPM